MANHKKQFNVKVLSTVDKLGEKKNLKNQLS